MRERTVNSDGLAAMVDFVTILCWTKVEPIFSHTLIRSFEIFLLQKPAAIMISKVLVIQTRFMARALGPSIGG